MKDDTPGRSGTRARLRGALVVAQVAVSLMLLVAAGLVFRGLETARRHRRGIRSARGRFGVDRPPAGRLHERRPARVFLDRLLREVRSRRVDRIGERGPVRAPGAWSIPERNPWPSKATSRAPTKTCSSCSTASGPDYFTTLRIDDARGAGVRGRRRCRGAEGGDRQRDDGAPVLGEPARGDRQAHRHLAGRLAHHRRRGARSQVLPADRDAAAVCLPGGGAELPIGRW